MRLLRFPLAVAVLLSASFATGPARAASIDAAAIEKTLGRPGRWMDREKAFRIDLDRDGWLAFKSGREGMVILTGRLLLREHEINPALSAAVEGTIQVTSLVVATPLTTPPAYAMFVTGDARGDVLAADARKLLDAIKRVNAETTAEPGSAGPAQPATNAASSITPAALESVFGTAAARRDDRGRFVVAFGREVAMPCACTIGIEMGVASTAVFTGSDDRAEVTGQIACTFAEVQNVLRALRRGGLSVTALHNHLDGEAPRMLFAHFHGVGKAQDLAAKVKAALDVPAKKHPAPAGAGHEHHH